ncbi:MAG: hypothetical protein ACI8QC_004005 [Planctomycetota bacterium]|jgi:hypothetical protein
MNLAQFLRSSLLACLLSSCQTPTEFITHRQGVIGSGGGTAGSSSHGEDWSVRLTEQDLWITVEDAVVVFLAGAVDDQVTYRKERDTWTFALSGGEVQWTSRNIRVDGTDHALLDGELLAFDGQGRLTSL